MADVPRFHMLQFSRGEWSASGYSDRIICLARSPSLNSEARIDSASLHDRVCERVVDIRLVGGTTGDIRMIFDDLQPLEAGTSYVIFLERMEWPTQEGFETVLAPVAEGLGIFRPAGGGGYRNAAGLMVSESEFGS